MINRFEPVKLDVFRGLRTLEKQLDVPAGYSPDCQNVDFTAGTVSKRPGTTLMASLEGTGTDIVSLKEYVGLDTSQRKLLILTSDGQLRHTDTSTFLTTALFADSLYEQTLKSDMRMNSVTQFGREYIAFASNGHASAIRPRQYDTVNLDPVAPEGPGDPPDFADGSVDATNGLTAGVHKFRVFFRTRTGHWTTLSPPVTYTAPGGKLVNATNIPTGPAWVTARVICATPEGSDDFFFIEGSKMVVGDNTTTSVTGIGWGADNALISGTPVSSQTNPDEDLLRLTSLPAQAGVVAFRGRLGWWGERNTIVRANDQGFLNLSMNGGVKASAPNVPCGWTEQISGGTVTTETDAVGTVFKITGDGTNQKGRLENKVHSLGVLPAGVSIRGRMRLKKSALAAAGTVHMYLVPLSTGATVSGMSVDVSELSSSEWRLIDKEVISAANNLPNADWVLRISSGGAPGGGTAITNGQWIAIDELELYEATDPTNKSLIRWSKVDEPESYDDLFGDQTVAENNGQDIRSMFVLRDTCYAAKERSLFAIRDNPDAEPSDWGAQEISGSIGTYAPKGVGIGDGWALIAARDGLYAFDGSSLSASDNVALEIQPTWQRINWKYGHKIEVHVNPEAGQAFVLAPLDGATAQTHVLYLRYLGGDPKNLQARDWSLWPLAVNCAAFAERPSDRVRSLYFGTVATLLDGETKGRLLRLNSAAVNDFEGAVNPVAINAYYQTYFIGEPYARRLFGYLTMNITGVGWLRLDAVRQSGSDWLSRRQLAARYLDRFPMFDKEWIIDLTGERMAFRLGVQSLKEKFELRKMTVFQRESPWQKIRGVPS